MVFNFVSSGSTYSSVCIYYLYMHNYILTLCVSQWFPGGDDSVLDSWGAVSCGVRHFLSSVMKTRAEEDADCPK